jgi:uncharacterized membrane protein (DUF2068 family)
MRSSSGVRVVAGIEALKGLLVLAAGFGVLALVHHPAQAVAERLVQRLHLNPAHHYPRVFLDALGGVTDTQLRWLAAGAGAYALVRFIEAYGLWRARRWAEWFAVVSGGIYVPFELYELTQGVTGLKLAALGINLAIVGYLARVLARRSPAH